jgi:hypothetical protein
LSELYATVGFDAVSDGNDYVEIVVVYLVDFSIGGSCCKFCNNSFAVEFAFLEYIPYVPGNHGFIALEQFGYLVERQPDRFIHEPGLDPRTSIPGLVNENLRFRSDHVFDPRIEHTPEKKKRPPELSMLGRGSAGSL